MTRINGVAEHSVVPPDDCIKCFFFLFMEVATMGRKRRLLMFFVRILVLVLCHVVEIIYAAGCCKLKK